MKILFFAYLIIFYTLSYSAYGTNFDPEMRDNQTPCTMTCDQVIEELSNVGPTEEIEINGMSYTPSEFYTMVGANDANTARGHKYKIELEECRRELEKLIDVHFTRDQAGCYKSKSTIFENTTDYGIVIDLTKKCLKLIPIFDDNDVRFKMGLMLTICNDALACSLAQTFLSQNIISRNHDTHLDRAGILAYLESYQFFKKEKLNGGKIILNIEEILLWPKKYLSKHPIEPLKEAMFIKKAIIECWRDLFSLIQKIYPTTHVDYTEAAFICMMVMIQENYNHQGYVEAIAEDFYKTFGSEKMTPNLKLFYADCLRNKMEYSEALPWYESLIDGKDDQEMYMPRFLPCDYLYQQIALCQFKLDDYPACLQTCEQSLAIEDNLIKRWNIAVVKTSCGNYDEALLESMKALAETPSNVLKQLNLNPALVKGSYQFTLEQAGKTDELDQLLFAEQEKAIQKALARESKYSALPSLLAEKHEQEQQRQKIKSAKPNIKKPQTPKTTSTGSTESTTASTSTVSYFVSNKENDSPQAKKIKEKTKGTSNPRLTSLVTKEAAQEQSKPLIYIDTLTNNSNALKTFAKLFMFHQTKNCFDNEVKISLHKINALFKALKQKYDPSQGKGSHKKATLNFKDMGSEMTEQMITLTKSTYIKEYQIKQIREAFAKAGIVPNDPQIIGKLKAEELL